jgi:Sulfotransferase family
MEQETTAKSCAVLGAGRSGTSLIAGLLASAGYFAGSRLLPPSALNPRGFFEDRHVNRINERLLSQATDAGVFRRPQTDKTFSEGQRWLAALPPESRFHVGPILATRMFHVTWSRQPFCLKDPRFCYTIDAWKPFLRGARLVCVFREPGRTATSMLRAVQEDRGLHGFDLSFEGALEVWKCMYESALRKYEEDEGRWLFVHYDDLLEPDGVARLERFLGTQLDSSFVSPELRRSQDVPVDEPFDALYRELQVLSTQQVS